MARNNMSTPTPVPNPPAAPDSPRESESPPPPGPQGDLEMELLSLATSLYNLGTTVVGDLTKEKDKPGGAAGKPVGIRVNEVIYHLSQLESMSESIDTMVPMQVLVDIDNSRNPMQLTKDRLERAATENQFMNGKIHAIDSYRKMLDEALVQNFPEIGEHLMESSLLTATQQSVKVEDAGASNGLPNGV
ncbi:transcription factor subunit Med10 of mediator complex-domain-containing protein [Daedaleopsis nitida]|nr:transcription factor subunit Med10 of mediator complex-domain-containing protein [Daedaleopsis nitida]